MGSSESGRYVKFECTRRDCKKTFNGLFMGFRPDGNRSYFFPEDKQEHDYNHSSKGEAFAYVSDTNIPDVGSLVCGLGLLKVGLNHAYHSGCGTYGYNAKAASKCFVSELQKVNRHYPADSHSFPNFTELFDDLCVATKKEVTYSCNQMNAILHVLYLLGENNYDWELRRIRDLTTEERLEGANALRTVGLKTEEPAKTERETVYA